MVKNGEASDPSLELDPPDSEVATYHTGPTNLASHVAPKAPMFEPLLSDPRAGEFAASP